MWQDLKEVLRWLSGEEEQAEEGVPSATTGALMRLVAMTTMAGIHAHRKGAEEEEEKQSGQAPSGTIKDIPPPGPASA